MVLSEKVSIFNEKRWKLSGNWQTLQLPDENTAVKARQAKFAGKKGDAIEFAFEGTAISLEGNWKKDAGKAELYIDDKLHSTFDTYFYYNKQEQTPINICHALHLNPGKHTLKLVVTGDKTLTFVWDFDNQIYIDIQGNCECDPPTVLFR